MASRRHKRKSNSRKIKVRKNRRTMKRGGYGKPCNLSFDYITNAANRPNHGF